MMKGGVKKKKRKKKKRKSHDSSLPALSLSQHLLCTNKEKHPFFRYYKAKQIKPEKLSNKIMIKSNIFYQIWD